MTPPLVERCACDSAVNRALADLSICLRCGGRLKVVNIVVRGGGTERMAVVECVEDRHHQFEVVTHMRQKGHGRLAGVA